MTANDNESVTLVEHDLIRKIDKYVHLANDGTVQLDDWYSIDDLEKIIDALKSIRSNSA